MKPLQTWVLLALVMIALNFRAMCQENLTTQITYKDENQVDPPALHIRSLRGVAKDDWGNAIPTIAIGLFSESGHRLNASTKTDDNGKFQINDVKPGRYRLVTSFVGFCTANVPVIIAGKNILYSSKPLILHMKLRSLDACSFGDLK